MCGANRTKHLISARNCSGSNKQTPTKMLNVKRRIAFNFIFTRCKTRRPASPFAIPQTEPRYDSSHLQQMYCLESTCCSATILIHDFLFSQITSISRKTKKIRTWLCAVHRGNAMRGFCSRPIPAQDIYASVRAVCLNSPANWKQKKVEKKNKTLFNNNGAIHSRALRCSAVRFQYFTFG